jgi:hypothetical protein
MGFTEINGNLGVYIMPAGSFKWKHYEDSVPKSSDERNVAPLHKIYNSILI